jgi:hypothetical protein
VGLWGIKWPRAGRLRARCATWAQSPRRARSSGGRLREDEGADRGGPQAERERERTHTQGKRQRRQGRPAGAERGRGSGRARVGLAGPKGRGERGLRATLPFSFISEIVSLFFLFTPFDSIPNMPQFQISTLKHMHQTKLEFRVQHDATFHTPLEFSLLDYNYIYK